MNTPRIEELVEELRDFFDTTLKPKKVTMKNLERELLVDFVRKAHQAGREELLELEKGRRP